MLTTILAAIAAAGRPMCRADIAASVDVDESALDGMLATLEARGRVRASPGADAVCFACPIRSGCFIMADGVARTYALIDPPPLVAGRPLPGAASPMP
jgi:hypothetical protein